MKFSDLKQYGWTRRVLSLVKYQIEKDKYCMFSLTLMQNLKNKTNEQIETKQNQTQIQRTAWEKWLPVGEG